GGGGGGGGGRGGGGGGGLKAEGMAWPCEVERVGVILAYTHAELRIRRIAASKGAGSTIIKSFCATLGSKVYSSTFTTKTTLATLNSRPDSGAPAPPSPSPPPPLLLRRSQDSEAPPPLPRSPSPRHHM
ncbi:hypothetical protein GOP47_0014118, partial [Adiantum capillus-veneris]